MNLDWFRLSYHSIGTLTAAILCFLMVLFLLTKKDKTTPTWWLAGFFVGVFSIFGGYFSAYSVYDTWGAYHRIFTVGVILGEMCMIQFAYSFPRNEHPKESKIVLVLSAILSFGLWAHFIIKTWGMDKIYKFEAHHYNFDFGTEAGIGIALEFLWIFIVLSRKTIMYSDYNGSLSRFVKAKPVSFGEGIIHYITRFIVGFIKVFRPRGKDAVATRNFSISVLMVFMIAIMNIFVKSGKISYDVYAFVFATSSLITYFAIIIVYINSSPEPTTFMIKLVGISLVTLLIAFATVGNITLSTGETGFDNEHIAETKVSKKDILAKKFEDLPEPIVYVATRPLTGGLYSSLYQVLFTRDPAITSELLVKSDASDRSVSLKDRAEKIKKAKKGLTLEDAQKEASKDMEYAQGPEMARLYRNAGKFYIHYDFVQNETRYEIGYSYNEYRDYTHEIGIKLFFIIIGTTVSILLLFPLFFKASLVNPLNDLLSGVTKVNEGDLNIVVPVHVTDEIGFLAGSFNSMVTSIREARKELEDYAENLEDKVKERTREVQEKMEEVHALKVQQDGDYFLTSLLAKPLFYNANKSQSVSTEFIIRQKKNFEFRNKKADLGGDICVTGNLKFGTPDNFKRFTMAMNGDAMGKSMQGAGGSLVMGVVMNSIMARSAGNKRVIDVTPEKWLTDIYNEVHGVFKTFNGTMVISCVVMLLDDETGDIYYFNAEHPFSVLYRDGKASFIEDKLNLRKLGLDSEINFQVFKTKIYPGDVIIIASDGRDDLDLTPDQPIRTINDDETIFLRHVEEGKGTLHEIEQQIHEFGKITDDLSLLRIGFKENMGSHSSDGSNVNRAPEIATEEDAVVIDIDPDDDFDVEALYLDAKRLLKEGNNREALAVLRDGFSKSQGNMRLNKLYGLLTFKEKEYDAAISVLNKYLEYDPDLADFWYYLSIAQKKTGKYDLSLKTSEKIHSLDPNNVSNLVNLSDLNRLLGNQEKALEFANKALELDPENRNAKRLLDVMNS